MNVRTNGTAELRIEGDGGCQVSYSIEFLNGENAGIFKRRPPMLREADGKPCFISWVEFVLQ